MADVLIPIFYSMLACYTILVLDLVTVVNQTRGYGTFWLQMTCRISCNYMVGHTVCGT